MLFVSRERVLRTDTHLRQILKTYVVYYYEVRAHLSLDKDAPAFRRAQLVGAIAALPVFGGLHHEYTRSSF